MITFKNKETNKLYTLIGSTSCSEGSYFTLATQPDKESNGDVIVNVPFRDVYEKFEIVNDNLDYESVWPLIKNYMHLNPQIGSLFDAFFRRNTKDYYIPGKYVFVTQISSDPRYYSGPMDNIYIIKGIGNGDSGMELILVKDINDPKGRELRIKINTDRIVPDDAYSRVRRLDMPY